MIHIYSDESRHRNEQFLLLGGLWIEEENLPVLHERVNEIRARYGYTDDNGKHVDFLGEFKWTKVSNNSLPIYKEVIDLFFDLIEEHIIRFCCMLVDTQDPAIAEQNNLEKEGFYKLLYQLYLHNCRVPGQYKIFPDQITNPTHNVNFSILNKALENGLRSKFADKVNPQNAPDRYLLQNTPIDSKRSQELQLVDVFIGALGYFQNRLFEADDASQAKTELMHYLIDKLVYAGTFKIQGKKYIVVRSTRLNIWLFRPKNKNNP